MAAFKQFLASDVVVTPFELNKSFTFKGNELTGSQVEINRLIGQNLTGSFCAATDPTTGTVSTEYSRLIFRAVQELYYSNYLTGSFVTATTRSLYPGVDESGDVYVGDKSSTGRYENYLASSLTTRDTFPTESMASIGVVSIPSKLYGTKIKPNTFKMVSVSGSITDDGEGNLFLDGSTPIGNILYQHGLALLTNAASAANLFGAIYGSGTYGSSTYGGVFAAKGLLEAFMTETNVTCSFTSSFNVFDTQYKCTINSNEFNFSLNPSLISGSTDGTVYDFVTGSYFNPYVTTVGLYNENQELLAVGKMSQPLPLNSTTDTNIIINIDR